MKIGTFVMLGPKDNPKELALASRLMLPVEIIFDLDGRRLEDDTLEYLAIGYDTLDGRKVLWEPDPRVGDALAKLRVFAFPVPLGI